MSAGSPDPGRLVRPGSWQALQAAWLDAIDAKLGRCVRCMRLSALLAFGSAVLLVVVWRSDPGPVVMLLAGAAFAVCAVWLAAHGIAYAVRGPDRAKGCRSCAERARQRRRDQRWRRLTRWLRPATPPPQVSMRDAPPADADLLPLVQESPEFGQLLPRLAAREPADHWRAGGLHYFLFELLDEAHSTLPPHAVFVMRPSLYVPAMAYIVHPDPAGGPPLVQDLRGASAAAGRAKASRAS